MESKFYVLYNKKSESLMMPGVNRTTRNPILAKKFDTEKEAKKEITNQNDPENWVILDGIITITINE